MSFENYYCLVPAGEISQDHVNNSLAYSMSQLPLVKLKEQFLLVLTVTNSYYVVEFNWHDLKSNCFDKYVWYDAGQIRKIIEEQTT